jgi:dihydrofolate reductase
MRKIRIFQHISLDGMISPGGANDDSDYANGGWTAAYRTPAGAQMLADAYGERYDLLLGRRTYDLWSKVWPSAKGGPFADRLNAATKFVATHRPTTLAWGPAQGLGDDILAGIRRVQATDGPDLIVSGSSTLSGVLLEHELADEVILIVYPLLFGQGKPFFPHTATPRELALINTKSTPTGVVINRYRHVGAPKSRTDSPGR